MSKYIKKISADEKFDFDESNFKERDSIVQGARVLDYENKTVIYSKKRFKLFTESTDYVKILSLEGEGHFKWSRGELPFKEGDAFAVNGVGEYELNASGKFLIISE